jgi:hypothetical protein
MAAQLPGTAQGASSVDGADALKYLGYLRRAIPGTNVYLTAASAVASCALREGVLGARAYVTNNLSLGTIVLVLSDLQLRNWQQVIFECTIGRLPFVGGGPSSPCAEVYSYDDTTSAVHTRYYVFVASTAQSECTNVRKFHANKGVVTSLWTA